VSGIINFALGHSRTVLSTLVLLLIAGAYAYVVIPKESSPDVSIPVMYVSVHHEGISPEDAERLLVQPLEQELRGIEGLDEIRAIAYESGANVIMEFEAGFDADAALRDVREKVDIAKPELPQEADDPSVHEVNLSQFPVLVVTLSGEVPARTLIDLADRLRDEIETLPQVLEAQLQGDRDERIELVVDPAMMESYGIDARQVQQAVQRSNQLVAAGSLDTGQGRFAVKVPGLFADHEDILNMPVKVAGDSAVTFGDIGTLRRTFEDPESHARINGERAVALEVSKRSGENIIETIERTRALVDAASQRWPETIHVTYSQDNSAQIRTMLSDLQNNVLSAILLVMVIIVAVLGLRTAGLVGLAIPGSFLTGILVIYVAGLTVNVVVLFSLILAVGMLVDGAIVVVEYADRKLREGEPPLRAYGLAARRMAWPIIAATATTLAAFFPLLFWPGTVGEFMKFLPITLLATLTASLAMALIFVPTLGSVLGRGRRRPEAEGGATAQTIARGSTEDLTALRGPTGAYLRVLRRALGRPALVLACAVVALVAGIGAYSQFGRGIEFFPDTEPDNAVLNVHARGNLSMLQRDRLVQEVESKVLQLHRERQEFHAIYARSQISSGQRREEPEDIVGKIHLEFVDWWKRRPADEILADIKERASSLAGIRVESDTEQMGPPTGKAIQIELTAGDHEKLPAAVDRIVTHMRADGGYTGIEDSRPVPGIAWELDVDRAQAAKFGADVALIGSYVRMVTNGLKLGEYRTAQADEEIDIVVRFPTAQRSLDQLDRIRLETGMGSVPVSNFVTRTPRPRTPLIKRTNGQRAMTVKADVAAGVLASEKVQDLQAWLSREEPLPRGVRVSFKGEDKEQREAAGFLTKAFAVALFLMAIILVTQFNSFYSAFLILSAVVLSTMGVVLGLLLTNQPFGIVMSGIGVIALAGIVVNNNIVLIDTYDRLKAQEPDALQAILRTGAQRLRPVLLTTVTTVLGLMPMVLGVNIDFVNRLVQVGAPSTELWRQLSTSIVAGLTFATVLTLLITPCALMLRANIATWWRRRRGLEPPSDAPAADAGSAIRRLPNAAE
jgi:multidrug efflux pump